MGPPRVRKEEKVTFSSTTYLLPPHWGFSTQELIKPTQQTSGGGHIIITALQTEMM